MPSLAVIERGSHRVAAFLLDDPASASVATAGVPGWLDALIQRTQSRDEALVSVWQRAEKLVTKPGDLTGWEELLAALDGGRPELMTVLPHRNIRLGRPAAPVDLTDCCVVEQAPYGSRERASLWAQFPREHHDIDTLVRRMQRASDKLREAVTTMEEEGAEESWSDGLATAQRLVFSAQSPVFRPLLPKNERRGAARSRAVRKSCRAKPSLRISSRARTTGSR